MTAMNATTKLHIPVYSLLSISRTIGKSRPTYNILQVLYYEMVGGAPWLLGSRVQLLSDW